MPETAPELDSLAASWDERLRCTAKVDDHTTCGRDAAWRWRFHDCSAGVLCAEHLLHWLRSVAQIDWPAPCSRCRRVFATQDAACTVVAL